MDVKKIKEKAREKLKGNYGVIVPVILIYGLICGAFAGAADLVYNQNLDYIFNIIITGLLYEGVIDVVAKVANGKKTDIKDLFNKTDLFWKAAAISIGIFILSTVCGAMGFIAAKSLSVFISYKTELNVLLTALMIFVGIILCVAIFIFYISIMLSFSQAYFILYENEKMPVLDIFAKSMEMMEDYKMDLVLLDLSFIGWLILGLFTCGILYLWLIPYMMVSEYNFYLELKKLNKKKK